MDMSKAEIFPYVQNILVSKKIIFSAAYVFCEPSISPDQTTPYLLRSCPSLALLNTGYEKDLFREIPSTTTRGTPGNIEIPREAEEERKEAGSASHKPGRLFLYFFFPFFPNKTRHGAWK